MTHPVADRMRATGVVARALGRHFVGIELKPEHLDLALPRFAQQPLLAGLADAGDAA